MDVSDDSIDILDIYISTFEELVDKFKKKKNLNKFQKDEVNNILKLIQNFIVLFTICRSRR